MNTPLMKQVKVQTDLWPFSMDPLGKLGQTRPSIIAGNLIYIEHRQYSILVFALSEGLALWLVL